MLPSQWSRHWEARARDEQGLSVFLSSLRIYNAFESLRHADHSLGFEHRENRCAPDCLPVRLRLRALSKTSSGTSAC